MCCVWCVCVCVCVCVYVCVVDRLPYLFQRIGVPLVLLIEHQFSC